MHQCKTLTPCLTWKLALLLPTRHKRNIADCKQQPEMVSQKESSEVVEGSGQLVTHPLLSLPPHRYFRTTQVPCQAVNRGGIITLGRQPKMGWNRRLQWNQLSASTPKKSSRDRGARSAFLQTFSFHFLSTIFHFQPQPLHTIVLILVVGWGIFPYMFLLNIPYSKTVGSIWAY